MYDHEQLIAAVLSGGASKATVIPQEKIVTDRSFWDICVGNGCGNFGRSWMCPPYIGQIDELMATVHSYTHGILYQTIGTLEDSFDIEGMGEAGKHHMQVSQRVHDAVKPLLAENCLHLSSSCRLCERCAKLDDQPCRLPDRALMPMEGCGIDVYNTTKGTELKYINGTNTVTFFGLVLFREENDG